MPKFKHYTDKMVKRQLAAIVRRNPEAVNPALNGDCLYHQGRGRNIRRCLLGQWGYEQGFKTPRPINGSVDEVVEELWGSQAKIDPEAVSLMLRAQNQADGHSYVADPIAWKGVLSLLT